MRGLMIGLAATVGSLAACNRGSDAVGAPQAEVINGFTLSEVQFATVPGFKETARIFATGQHPDGYPGCRMASSSSARAAVSVAPLGTSSG